MKLHKIVVDIIFFIHYNYIVSILTIKNQQKFMKKDVISC